eukprot:c16326_g1_i1.p1 GENE.c16326_g1_i1~~c16326_g1_i1.p1  ORF type:complete len:329 (+),score=72.34 c16326_g1_i1:101-1087(+)
MNLNHIFDQVKLGDLPAVSEGRIIVLADNCALDDAVSTLCGARVQSAPVKRASAPEDAEFDKKFVGYVDMVHIAGAVLKQVEGADRVSDLHGFLDEMDLFHNMSLSDLKLPPLVPVSIDSTLLDAILVMTKYNCRRLALISPSFQSLPGTLNNFLTPSFILSTVNQICEKESIDLSKLSVKDFGMVFGRVISVKQTAQFSEALALFTENNISALAVVNSAGQLVYNLSATDIRQIVEYPILYEVVKRSRATVGEFFECLRESDLPVKQPITCTKETTVQELVLMMSANKIHRLYVVNDQNKPVGVVTILDVLAQLVESPSADEEILVE